MEIDRTGSREIERSRTATPKAHLKTQIPHTERDTVQISGKAGTDPLVPREIMKRPASPLYRPAQGQEGAEAVRLAESLICAEGIRPEVKSVIVRDLAAFPAPVLRLLKSDGLDIAVVREGRTLADTPLLPTVKPEEYQALAMKGKAVFDAAAEEEAEVTRREIEESKRSGNDDPFHMGMVQYWEADRLKKTLSERLIKENLGFSVHAAREPEDLRGLALRHGVESDDDFAEWEKTFRLINGDHVMTSDGKVQGSQGVLLVPYTYYHGRPVSQTTLESLRHYDSQRVKDALGIHLWEDRIIILHEDYAADPGREVGHYRIVLHETGHALDHALERVPGTGEEHRKNMNDLYARDLRELKSGGPNRFVSPRAMDNVREYFAEAVESYLTVCTGDEHEYYKTANNRDELRRLNPELFSYVESLMNTAFPAGAQPDLPADGESILQK